jgi:catechol 2,3-dioxygenase-like lactoylglutathione lyase family enzyme
LDRENVSGEAKPGIARLHPAQIRVHDRNKAVDAYVNTLGFETWIDDPVDKEGHRWFEVARQGSETVVILSHGFCSRNPEKVGGCRRLIFRVDDMAGTVEALKDEPEGVPYRTRVGAGSVRKRLWDVQG